MRTKYSFAVLALILVSSGVANAQWRTFNPVTSVEQKPDRIVMPLISGVLTIQICSDSILHITSSPTATPPERPEFVIQKTSWPTPKFAVKDEAEDVTITT